MKINILRRIEALEQRAKRATAPPSLIVISYEKRLKKWQVVEHYPWAKTGIFDEYKTVISTFDRLQEFFFPADFKGRVILNTFASPDPAIYGNLFCFNVDDLREGQPGEIAIQSITEPNDEKSVAVSIDTCSKDREN